MGYIHIRKDVCDTKIYFVLLDLDCWVESLKVTLKRNELLVILPKNLQEAICKGCHQTEVIVGSRNQCVINLRAII